MEGQGKPGERPLRRSYRQHRLEDQLWAMAYEQVWPLVRRALQESIAEGEGSERNAIAAAPRLARRA